MTVITKAEHFFAPVEILTQAKKCEVNAPLIIIRSVLQCWILATYHVVGSTEFPLYGLKSKNRLGHSLIT